MRVELKAHNKKNHIIVPLGYHKHTFHLSQTIYMFIYTEITNCLMDILQKFSNYVVVVMRTKKTFVYEFLFCSWITFSETKIFFKNLMVHLQNSKLL